MSASKPRRNEDLVVRDFQDGAETAILDLASGQVVSLNATAAAIWYLCDGERDEAAIAREVVDVHPDVDPVLALNDVRRTLAELAERGLVG